MFEAKTKQCVKCKKVKFLAEFRSVKKSAWKVTNECCACLALRGKKKEVMTAPSCTFSPFKKSIIS